MCAFFSSYSKNVGSDWMFPWFFVFVLHNFLAIKSLKNFFLFNTELEGEGISPYPSVSIKVVTCLWPGDLVLEELGRQ